MPTALNALIMSLAETPDNLAEIRDQIASLGLLELKKILKESGLDIAGKVTNAKTAADIAIAVFVPSIRAERSEEAKTHEGLLSGHIFEDDEPEIVYRFAARPSEDEINIWKITESDGKLKIVKDYKFAKEELQCSVLTLPLVEEGETEEVPEEGTPTTPDDSDEPTGTIIETVALSHYKVDLKLIFTIPFVPNDFPVPSQLLHTRWRGAAMTQEERYAARAMLATGNAPPPDLFPTEASWNTYIASKEYRALLHIQFYICCPQAANQNSATVKLTKVGYTPHPSSILLAPAGTLRARLEADHNLRQSVGNQAENIAAGDGALGAALGLGSIPGATLVAPSNLGVIRELRNRYHGTTPGIRSHSEGEHKFGSRDMSTRNCSSGLLSYFFRVGSSHNLLNLGLTGNLIPYQGGDLTYRLCCSDGILRLSFNHTAVPSHDIYINNAKLANKSYDMLGASFPSIRSAVNGIGRPLSGLNNLGVFTRPAVPKRSSINVPITRKDGCDPIASGWWPTPQSA